MGKGDKRTTKGKRFSATYGLSRPKKKSTKVKKTKPTTKGKK